ncbi:Sec-independent protein translocase protein TatB [uncultured Paracoccus sp.]|uniref:Sec-independent protein translocase protein TatB n=1 Tax=uncultured Paracoccus sp. TaxID=189685 RepID=UPI0025F0D920|nr:Sec-independent protein translocase protein TatB [uncultured Paracoccus sp.]
MLDVGWSELLLIGVVALIVIGPEDLPKLFHTLGRITAKARSMAREFTSAMEDAAKGSGISEVSKDLKDLTSKKSLGLDALDRAATRFEQWDPKASLEKSTRAVPDPAAPAPADSRPVDAPAVPAPPVSAPLQAANESAAAPSAAASDSPRRIAGVRRSDMKDR